MDYQDYLRSVFALLLVLSLMGGLAFLLKRFGYGQAGMVSPKRRRLKTIEILPVDAKHKVVLLERDDQQHLVLFGTNGDTVIETNIKTPKIENDEEKK